MWKYIIAIVIALVAGIGIGTQMAGDGPATTAASDQEEATTYRCPMHPTVTDDHPGSCPICGMDLVPDRPVATGSGGGERVIAYWRAPMDPSFTSPEPGKSPMGMDLVPVYEDELAQEGTVKIDPVTVQNIGVRTAKVELRPIGRRIRTVGRVDYDETLMTDVNTKVAGWVENLHVDYTGQDVARGQPLLEIYSPELVAAQEEYLTALDYHERLRGNAAKEGVIRGAQDLLQASAQRLRYWDVTDEQIAELERRRVVRRTMTIYSPQQGVVVHKAVFDGQHIKPGQHLYRIADLSRVWVHADIYENELPWITTGQPANVDLSYLPGRTFRGEISYIYPYLDSKTRTVQIRLVFDNADGVLKPDMYANVSAEAMLADKAITIPVQAVIHTGERHVAVVNLGEGRFQPRDIQVGVESDGRYQVLSGLRVGEEIVTSAQFLIDSESNLKAAVSDMRGGGGSEVPADDTTEHEGMSHEDMDHDEMAAGESPADSQATAPDEHAGHTQPAEDHSDH